MYDLTLTQVALFLAAAVIAAPLAKLLRVANVLGYLLVGVLIGPYGLGLVYTLYEVNSVLHLAEFGVIMLLFVIGLELRPKRLWAMRAGIFGLGSTQVAVTGIALAAAGMAFGLTWQAALFAGLALSLSSTAFALQVLEEKGELALRHGRLAFAVLLFQDLAAIPLIALAPLFAVSAAAAAQQMEITAALKAIGVILAVVVVGPLPPQRRLSPGRAHAREGGHDGERAPHRGGRDAGHAAGGAARLARRLHRRRAARRLRLPPRDRGRHRPLRRPAARPVLHRHRHVAQPRPDGAEPALRARHRRRPALPSRPPSCSCWGAAWGSSPGPRDAWRWPSRRAASSPSCCSRPGVIAGVLDRQVADLLSVAVTLSMAATPLLLLLDELLGAQGQAGPRLRRDARQRRPRRDRRLRPRRPDRGARPERQAHPRHGTGHRPRAGRLRAQVRRPDLLRRRQPATRSWRPPRPARLALSCSPSTTSRPP